MKIFDESNLIGTKYRKIYPKGMVGTVGIESNLTTMGSYDAFCYGKTKAGTFGFCAS